MYDFKGRSLLMTGANGGISRAIAAEFYACGANMVLTDLNEKALGDFAQELDPSGERIVVAKVDVTESANADAAARLCNERFGGIDFLVTAAGHFPRSPTRDMTDEEWRDIIAINLDGTFYISRAVMPYLRDNSAMVHVASLAGHAGVIWHSHYGAAKGGVLSFARSLAKELAPRTRVNSVSPGIIDTPMVRAIMDSDGDAWLASTLLRRMGDPREVATVVSFLCSDGASFLTGETIHINGGLYIAS
ncbi:SDR family NAD(P)-dependent oxidoreductase [Paraburkholderia rhynchosiae]|uniref:3-oxoacyl-ACP reductase n=1 Tax=Paraburkholderia rhynchosiae TaxID=487049 RepID=A0A2N7WH28_9BURK|nr:SDR family NAD(P)-dependent oxidoreductase [Paraburkholderia rhynchosiae]PMS28776.1 3-oxoacyl-ACP reductase [Paraburkholderia rhynchosiae]CAB3657003.1 3-oxoacyl-[acyl-carrier-protein] reductase FabG [Paraburkholderia rhynchosiae]